MVRKSQQLKHKQKLTDAERHKRFVAMALEVGAHKATEAFDKVFRKVVAAKPKR